MPDAMPKNNKIDEILPDGEVIWPRESMRIALLIKKIFERPVEEFYDDYKSVHKLRPYCFNMDHLAFHSFLEEESSKIPNYFAAMFRGYSWPQFKRAHSYFSQMVHALSVIDKHRKELNEPRSGEQMRLIDEYLVQGLLKMCSSLALNWLKIPCPLLECVSYVRSQERLLYELPGEKVKIVSYQWREFRLNAAFVRVCHQNDKLVADIHRLSRYNEKLLSGGVQPIEPESDEPGVYKYYEKQASDPSRDYEACAEIVINKITAEMREVEEEVDSLRALVNDAERAAARSMQARGGAGFFSSVRVELPQSDVLAPNPYALAG